MTAVVDINTLAHELMRITKEFFIKNGYGASPLVVILMGEGQSELVAAPEGVPPGTLYDAIVHLVKAVPFTPEMICMAMDTYALKIDKDSPEGAWKEAEALRAGDLGRRFAAGDPQVTEQLAVEVLRSGEEIMLQLPYKYTPVDGWEWGEVDTVPAGTSSDWDFDRIIAGLPKKSYKEMQKEQE